MKTEKNNCMYDPKGSGIRLRQLREELGKTQMEVAKETGLCIDTICKLEQGKRSPSVTVVNILRKYYNTTSDYIISGDTGQIEKEKFLFGVVPEQKRDIVEKLMENIIDLLT